MRLSKSSITICFSLLAMVVFFILGQPVMMDDGFHYEGFTESLAEGKLDFKSFYGFQGLSFFAVPIFWLTNSHHSIIFASMIFTLLSIPLIYFCAKTLYGTAKAGIYGIIIFLLMPYPYVTLMRGFQEAALLFFTLLVIYGALNQKKWTPIAWAVGGIVKPFALVLFPLFLKEAFFKKRLIWLIGGLMLGLIYIGLTYYQTGHLVNNAAINSYQGNFNTGNPPPLGKSFVLGAKGYLRVGANLLLHFRKIMLSPFIIVLGALSLLWNKNLKLRKEIILAIMLNFLLVGSLTFSFSKYLLPMTTLFALASVGYLLKYKWLMILVFADSLFVFFPIWNYFGKVFWNSLPVFLIPFWTALAIYLIYEFTSRHRYINSDLKRER